MTPTLPECESCGARDPSVLPGGDDEGVSYPSSCATCRCEHRWSRPSHDDDCRECPGYCLGCSGERWDYALVHDCGVTWRQEHDGLLVRVEGP